MAGKNEYVIILRNEANKARKNAIAGQTGGEEKDTTPNKDGDGKIPREYLKGYVAYKHYVEPFVKQSISYSISTVSIRTGRTEQQQRLQFAYDVGTNVFSMAEGAFMGLAVSGGNPLGALVGLGIKAVQMAVSYSHAQNTISLGRMEETLSIGLQNVRAGGSVASYNNSRGERK